MSNKALSFETEIQNYSTAYKSLHAFTLNERFMKMSSMLRASFTKSPFFRLRGTIKPRFSVDGQLRAIVHQQCASERGVLLL